MATFEPAVNLVLRHEGAYVFNPDDPGGATNYGVTLAVLASTRKGATTVADVKALTMTEAKEIYRTRYWSAIQGDKIASQDVANSCLDMAVLRGVAGAAVSIQQALGVAQDGIIGPKTLAALNVAAPAMFLTVFRSLCVRRFVSIVAARSASLQFLPGWVKRAEEMSDVVSLLLQKTLAQARAV